MNKLFKIAATVLGLAGVAYAGPSGPPAGLYILNVSTQVSNPAFSVASGTVRTQLNLGYGTQGSLLYLSTTGVVATTSTIPTGGDVFKASTQTFTGFNTFQGSTTLKRQVKVQTTATAGLGTGTGGSILVWATDETGMPFQVYTSSANQAGYFGLVNLIASNTAYANAVIYITGTSSSTAKADVYLNNPRPNIQLYQTGGASPYGQYEFVVVADTLQFNAMNSGGSAQKARLGMTHPGALAFYETSDNGHFVALKASATIASNVTWLLPTADGFANQVLATDGAGNLSWVTQSGSGGGTSGQINSASQNAVPRYSVTGSSNVLSGSSIMTDNGSTVSVSGVVSASAVSVSTLTVTSSATIVGSSGLSFSDSSGANVYTPNSAYGLLNLYGTTGSVGFQTSRALMSANGIQFYVDDLIPPDFKLCYGACTTGTEFFTVPTGVTTYTAYGGRKIRVSVSSSPGYVTMSSSLSVTGAGGITSTYGVSASTISISSAATFNGNIIISSTVADGSGSAGSNGYVLTSRGAGTSPTWQASSGGGGGASGLVNSASQFSAPYYSVVGSSNVLSGSSMMGIYPSSISVFGVLYATNVVQQGDSNFNTGIGVGALTSEISGSNNSALGYQALYSQNGGTSNMGVGYQSLYTNTSGNYNTAVGASALNTMDGSIDNTAIGFEAGGGFAKGSDNTFIGYFAGLRDLGSNNVYIGSGAGAALPSRTLTNAVAIGYAASAASSNTMVLGGVGTANALTVITSTITSSSATFKTFNTTGTYTAFGSVVIATASAILATNSSGVIVSTTIDVGAANVGGTLAAGRFPALTGDVTTSAGSLATTLASVVTANQFGSATVVPVITFNAKGLVTAVSSATISASGGGVTVPSSFTWTGVIASSVQVTGGGGLNVTYGLTAGTGTFYTTTVSTNAVIWQSTTNLTSMRYDNTLPVAGDFMLSIATIPSNGTSTMVLGVNTYGHVVSSGPVPTVSSCGSSPSVDGNSTDFAGTINTGSSSPSACTLTFANPFLTVPVCIVSDDLQTSEPAVTSRSTTAITLTLGAALNSGHIFYICVGQKG